MCIYVYIYTCMYVSQILIFFKHHALRRQFPPCIRLRLHVQPLGEYEGSGATMEPSAGDPVLPSSLIIIAIIGYYGGSMIKFIYLCLLGIIQHHPERTSSSHRRDRAIVLKCTSSEGDPSDQALTLMKGIIHDLSPDALGGHLTLSS